jgi:hypothetical protein
LQVLQRFLFVFFGSRLHSLRLSLVTPLARAPTYADVLTCADVYVTFHPRMDKDSRIKSFEGPILNSRGHTGPEIGLLK